VPTLEIGTVDGPAAVTFHDVRGAMSIQDSLIVIADGGAKELRVFSNSGDFITKFGREGGGPREFEGMGWADTCGSDTVVAYDFARHRITKWDTKGTLLDEFFVQGPEASMPPYSLDCGPNGTFAVVGWPDFLAYSGGVGPYRFDVKVGVVDRQGRLERVLSTFPGPERYRYESWSPPGLDAPASTSTDRVLNETEDMLTGVLVLVGGSHTPGRQCVPDPIGPV